MNARYVPGQGVLIQIVVGSSGIGLIVPSHWTVQAIENHLEEVREWLA